MDLGFSESQENLKLEARRFLEEECPSSLVRQAEREEAGYSSELWRKIAEQGWLRLGLPQSAGGSSFLDLCAVFEEMGRALVPGPFLDVVLAENLLLDLDPDVDKGLIGSLARGERIISVALTEETAGYAPDDVMLTAHASGDSYLLNGTKLFVTNAHIADDLLVVARCDDSGDSPQALTVFLVARSTPGVRVTRLKTVGLDNQCEVVFENVSVPATSLVGTLNQAWPALKKYLDRARVLTCVWSLGGADRVLEMTTEYAKTREQFGRPIGTFQAIAHKCADMAVDIDGMRFVIYHAAWCLGEGLPADFEIAVAKAWTADAYLRVTTAAHQVFGGIGVTMAHDIQMYSRRSKTAEVLFGDADYHREVVAQSIGL